MVYCVTVFGASQSAVRPHWLSLCTVWPSHSQWPSEQISFITTMRLPILELSCRLFFWQSITSPRSVSPPTAQIWLPVISSFSQSSPLKGRDLWMRRSHGTQTQSDCSRRHIKVSSDWLPNYIKATRPVLEIFKWLNTFRTDLVSLDLRLKTRVDISWSHSENLRVPWPKTETLCVCLSKADTTRVLNTTSFHYKNFYLLHAHKKLY